jgi:NADH-quinone oxidoreductase subunit I
MEKVQKRSAVGQYFRNLFDGIAAVYNGMRLTLYYMFQPKVSEIYPDKKRPLPQRFRGRFAFLFNKEDGNMLCIGCYACAKVCPPQTIVIETHKGEDKKLKVDRYEINIGECISCANCVEVCPVGALEMTHEFETAAFEQNDFVYGMDKLAKYVEKPNMYLPPEPAKGGKK